jgi:hypothetical protein
MARLPWAATQWRAIGVVTALAVVHVEASLEQQVYCVEAAALCCGEKQRRVVGRHFHVQLVRVLVEECPQMLDVASACGLDDLLVYRQLACVLGHRDLDCANG